MKTEKGYALQVGTSDKFYSTDEFMYGGTRLHTCKLKDVVVQTKDEAEELLNDILNDAEKLGIPVDLHVVPVCVSLDEYDT